MVPISAAMAAPTRPATGQHGREFACDGENNNAGNRTLGIKPGEARVGLQRQHHAGEERRHADDGQRVIADIGELADELLGEVWRREAMQHGLGNENRHLTQFLEKTENSRTQALYGGERVQSGGFLLCGHAASFYSCFAGLAP
jgi:hypothetical protein